MTDTPYNRKIQNFIEEYVNCSHKAVYANGMMKNQAVKEAVKLLIEEKVFLSVRSMRLQALKDYNIFLPAWVFQWVKENEK
ncbi:hypothetical protein [Eubacterium sp.]